MGELMFGEVDTHGIGLELHLDTGEISPREIWENKDHYINLANQSREEWEKMTEEQREAILRMVQGALERLHDRVEDWVPEGLRAEGGEWVDVNLRILMTDISKEIERSEQATRMRVDAAKADTVGMIADLGE